MWPTLFDPQHHIFQTLSITRCSPGGPQALLQSPTYFQHCRVEAAPHRQVLGLSTAPDDWELMGAPPESPLNKMQTK